MTENQRFGRLIAFLIESKRVRNQQQFTEEIRSDRSTVSEIKNGKIKIPNNMFRKIEIVFPDLSTNWLKTGEGEMLIKDEITEKAISMIREFGLSSINISQMKLTARDIRGYMNKTKIFDIEDAITLICYLEFLNDLSNEKFKYGGDKGDIYLRFFRIKYILKYLNFKDINKDTFAQKAKLHKQEKNEKFIKEVGWLDLENGEMAYIDVNSYGTIIAAFPELNGNWLLYGEGHMLRSKSFTSKEKELNIDYMEKYQETLKELNKAYIDLNARSIERNTRSAQQIEILNEYNKTLKQLLFFKQMIWKLKQSSDEERERLLDELFLYSLTILDNPSPPAVSSADEKQPSLPDV